MAKPLNVRTERSPQKKLALSEGSGLPIAVTTGAQIPVHIVPEGYKDEIHLWASNNDAANDGFQLIEINGNGNLTIIAPTPNRDAPTKILDGMVIEARSGDVVVDGLAITEPTVVWGWVFRQSIVE